MRATPDKLRWQKAIQNVIKPVNDKYKRALLNLEKKYKEQKKIEKANAVKREYDWILHNEQNVDATLKKAFPKISSSTIKNLNSKAVTEKQILGNWRAIHAPYMINEFLPKGKIRIYNNNQLTDALKNATWSIDKGRTILIKEGIRVAHVYIYIDNKLLIRVDYIRNKVVFLTR